MNPVERIVEWAVIEPVQDAQSEEVITTINLFAREFNVAL
jgi:hypothetical protein